MGKNCASKRVWRLHEAEVASASAIDIEYSLLPHHDLHECVVVEVLTSVLSLMGCVAAKGARWL